MLVRYKSAENIFKKKIIYKKNLEDVQWKSPSFKKKKTEHLLVGQAIT